MLRIPLRSWIKQDTRNHREPTVGEDKNTFKWNPEQNVLQITLTVNPKGAKINWVIVMHSQENNWIHSGGILFPLHRNRPNTGGIQVKGNLKEKRHTQFWVHQSPTNADSLLQLDFTVCFDSQSGESEEFCRNSKCVEHQTQEPQCEQSTTRLF